MRSRDAHELHGRIAQLLELVDKVDRSVERIEVVTMVREPSTALGVDAYDGLRKQVVAAASERNAHLHQLAQFDACLQNGASKEQLAALVREWMGQSALLSVYDIGMAELFEVVGGEGDDLAVMQPAYVDGVTGRPVRMGRAERVTRTAEADDPADTGPEIATVEAEVQA